jgi:tRNA threonylcarbamoyl adenosine modification protein (Sua5/YciO/YrdC/YwlC family)
MSTAPDPLGRKNLAAEIIRINKENPEAVLIAYAAQQLQQGEVLGMPTDTFYGLAADPFNLHAVERVYDIKSRSRHKPLSLLIESVEQADTLANYLSPEFYLLAERFWPGPLTIIVPAAPKLPLKVTANSGNVALRVPAAAIPLAVIRKSGMPITATSANLSGASECATAAAVRDQLAHRLNLIVDGGPAPHLLPSTIVDLTVDEIGKPSWRIQRQGAIPAQEITALLSGK